MSFTSLAKGLGAYVFSDIETEAREVREYAEATQRYMPAQVDELVEVWRAMSRTDRARALENMREQKRRHTERVERIMEAVEASRKPNQE